MKKTCYVKDFLKSLSKDTNYKLQEHKSGTYIWILDNQNNPVDRCICLNVYKSESEKKYMLYDNDGNLIQEIKTSSRGKKIKEFIDYTYEGEEQNYRRVTYTYTDDDYVEINFFDIHGECTWATIKCNSFIYDFPGELWRVKLDDEYLSMSYPY